MPDIELRFNKDMIVVEGDKAKLLQRQGFSDEPCLPYLNVLEPEAIIDIHRMYLLVGAQAAITNTYGATRAQLATHGLQDRMAEFNHAGVLLAQAVCPQHIFAAVGPCGIAISSLIDEQGEPSLAYRAALREYTDQITVLASDEPDAILLDTFGSLFDLLCALDAALTSCDLPLIASATFTTDGTLSQTGESVEEVAMAVSAAGASVFGLNCMVSPNEMLPLARRARKATDLPLMVRPDVPDNDLCKPQRPASSVDMITQMEDRTADYWRAGVQFVGACCGATPSYIGAIAGVIEGHDVVRTTMNPQ